MGLRYPDPVDRIFKCVISDISFVLVKIARTIPDSTEIGSEVVRVVSLSTGKITEITRFKNKPILRVQIP